MSKANTVDLFSVVVVVGVQYSINMHLESLSFDEMLNDKKHST